MLRYVTLSVLAMVGANMVSNLFGTMAVLVQQLSTVGIFVLAFLLVLKLAKPSE